MRHDALADDLPHQTLRTRREAQRAQRLVRHDSHIGLLLLSNYEIRSVGAKLKHARHLRELNVFLVITQRHQMRRSRDAPHLELSRNQQRGTQNVGVSSSVSR